jgi:type II secretory pathway pseudopilin PulG
MVALLIAMGVMAIMMSAAMPVWKTASQREKEAELVFRGQQYARAIELYQRKLPGAMPPNLDVLLDQKFLRKKYKDPITGDDFDILSPNAPAAGQVGPQGPPNAAGGRGASVPAGPGPAPQGGRGPAPQAGRGAAPTPTPSRGRGGPQGGTIGAQAGIAGVVSKSKATSIRLYNGRNRYNEWQFVYIPRATAPGAGAQGSTTPGQRGGPGMKPGIGPGGRGFQPGAGGGPGSFGRGDGRGNPPVQPGTVPGRGAQPFPQGMPPFPQPGQPLPQQPRSPGN